MTLCEKVHQRRSPLLFSSSARRENLGLCVGLQPKSVLSRGCWQPVVLPHALDLHVPLRMTAEPGDRINRFGSLWVLLLVLLQTMSCDWGGFAPNWVCTRAADVGVCRATYNLHAPQAGDCGCKLCWAGRSLALTLRSSLPCGF